MKINVHMTSVFIVAVDHPKSSKAQDTTEMRNRTSGIKISNPNTINIALKIDFTVIIFSKVIC